MTLQRFAARDASSWERAALVGALAYAGLVVAAGIPAPARAPSVPVERGTSCCHSRRLRGRRRGSMTVPHGGRARHRRRSWCRVGPHFVPGTSTARRPVPAGRGSRPCGSRFGIPRGDRSSWRRTSSSTCSSASNEGRIKARRPSSPTSKARWSRRPMVEMRLLSSSAATIPSPSGGRWSSCSNADAMSSSARRVACRPRAPPPRPLEARQAISRS